MEDTSKPETVYEDLATFATTQKETKTFVTNVEETTTDAATQHGPSPFITTGVPPRPTDQNTHHSLVVIAGHSARLSSSSRVSTIFRWSYGPLGSSELELKPVYNGFAIDPRFRFSRPKVSVSDCDDRNCTFNVVDLQLDDAGLFRCKQKTGRPTAFWSFTILGKYKSTRTYRYLHICCCTVTFIWSYLVLCPRY